MKNCRIVLILIILNIYWEYDTKLFKCEVSIFYSVLSPSFSQILTLS